MAVVLDDERKNETINLRSFDGRETKLEDIVATVPVDET